MFSGLVCIQMNTALRPSAIFMVTNRSQMNHFIYRVVSLSNVMPNDVLLKVAAMMDSIPDTFPFSSRVGSTDSSRL